MKLFVLDAGWRGGFAVIASDGAEARRLADAAAEAREGNVNCHLGEVLSAVDCGLLTWEVFAPGVVAILEGDA